MPSRRYDGTSVERHSSPDRLSTERSATDRHATRRPAVRSGTRRCVHLPTAALVIVAFGMTLHSVLFFPSQPPLMNDASATTTSTTTYPTQSLHRLVRPTRQASLSGIRDRLQNAYRLARTEVDRHIEMQRASLAQEEKNRTASETATATVKFYDGVPYVTKRFPNVFFAGRKNTTKKEEIVLCTHISINRMPAFHVQWRWWFDGPISVAVYVTSESDISYLLRWWESLVQTPMNHPDQWVSFHVVMEVSSSSSSTELAYPHNTLRNAALDFVRELSRYDPTHRYYFVANDVDFVPSWHCHAELQRLLCDDASTEGDEREYGKQEGERQQQQQQQRHQQKLQSTTIRHELLHNRRYMVLPGLTVQPPSRSARQELERSGRFVPSDAGLPRSSVQLQEKMKSGEVHLFHKNRFPKGHGPTDVDRWMGLEPTYTALDSRMWYPVEYADWFEPYVWGAMSAAAPPPRYFEDFRGYGMNKVSWIMELDRAGFRFGVVPPTAWVIHMYHPQGSANRRQSTINGRVALPRFEAHLKRTYSASAGSLSDPP